MVAGEIACSIKGDVKNIFLPPPGAAVLICDIQPLSPRRRSGVVALNDCISAAGIFFSSDDADLDPRGKVVMESILETKASTILEFFAGLRGTLSVTFEEGTWAAWLYDLLKPHVAKVVVCNPRKNARLKDGNKSDRIDARKLAELLRLDNLKSVYHGETGVRMLRELARSYLTIVKDLTRVMNRLKALYRSWAIPCAGRDVYYTRHRTEWLGKIREAGVRRRAEQLYQ